MSKFQQPEVCIKADKTNLCVCVKVDKRVAPLPWARTLECCTDIVFVPHLSLPHVYVTFMAVSLAERIPSKVRLALVNYYNTIFALPEGKTEIREFDELEHSHTAWNLLVPTGTSKLKTALQMQKAPDGKDNPARTAQINAAINAMKTVCLISSLRPS